MRQKSVAFPLIQVAWLHHTNLLFLPSNAGLSSFLTTNVMISKRSRLFLGKMQGNFSPCRKRSPAKGVWQKSDEISDRSIRKSDQEVTEIVPKRKKVIELLLPTSFCGTLNLVAPCCALLRDYLSDTPYSDTPYCGMGLCVSQCGQIGLGQSWCRGKSVGKIPSEIDSHCFVDPWVVLSQFQYVNPIPHPNSIVHTLLLIRVLRPCKSA